jgi:cell division protease FtsH
MSERLGFINYTPDPNRETIIADREYSQDTARVIDEEIKRLIDLAFADAERILEENWELVVSISENLLKYETLQSKEIEAIMNGESIDRPSINDLLAEESAAPSSSPESGSGDEPPADVAPSPA